MPAGYVYHVLNRGFLRSEIFGDDKDYDRFVTLLGAAQRTYEMRICAFSLMPNHWHLALWPSEDNIASRFVQHLTSQHVIAWRKRWGTSGHLYQGRFRSFPVQSEQYYISLIRYIEQNPVRAELVTLAWEWKWSSAWLRENADQDYNITLSNGPVPLPSDWKALLTILESKENYRQLTNSIRRSRPFGDKTWIDSTASELGLRSTLESHGGYRHGQKTENRSRSLTP